MVRPDPLIMHRLDYDGLIMHQCLLKFSESLGRLVAFSWAVSTPLLAIEVKHFIARGL